METGRVGLAWTVVAAPKPIGALTVGVTDAGLALVAFGDRPESARRVAHRLRLPLDDDPARTDPARAQLVEYLAGRRRAFTLPLDWRSATEPGRRVLAVLAETVPFGATVTYGELAERAGMGGSYTATRAIGSIMGANPFPVVVPCHRVLAADGLGGFGGGRAIKEFLLALEGSLTGTLFE